MTWRREKILIIGKTYPSPSRQQLETVCTGGISESGEWRRLYPVRFRYLGDEQKYRDWQWIEVEVRKYPRDPRLASHEIREATLRVVGQEATRENRWSRVQPMLAESMEEVWARQANDLHGVTMSAVEAEYLDITWQAVSRDWEGKQLEALQQRELFIEKKPLSKVPYDLYLHWRCVNNTACKTHRMRVLSWGINQAILNWPARYGSEEASLLKLRETYERECAKGRFIVFVGTLRHQLKTWCSGGHLIAPRSDPDPRLF